MRTIYDVIRVETFFTTRFSLLNSLNCFLHIINVYPIFYPLCWISRTWITSLNCISASSEHPSSLLDARLFLPLIFFTSFHRSLDLCSAIALAIFSILILSVFLTIYLAALWQRALVIPRISATSPSCGWLLAFHKWRHQRSMHTVLPST